jgi:hypothetical protein
MYAYPNLFIKYFLETSTLEDEGGAVAGYLNV